MFMLSNFTLNVGVTFSLWLVLYFIKYVHFMSICKLFSWNSFSLKKGTKSAEKRTCNLTIIAYHLLHVMYLAALPRGGHTILFHFLTSNFNLFLLLCLPRLSWETCLISSGGGTFFSFSLQTSTSSKSLSKVSLLVLLLVDILCVNQIATPTR